MTKPGSWPIALCVALALIIGLSAAPTLSRAVDTNPIIGDWEGTMDPGAKPKQRIVVHITAAQDGTLGGNIDYPDQDSSGVLITAITFKDRALHFESSSNLSAYDGTMNKDSLGITGTLKQSGASLSLNLKRTP